ncbi:MAG: nuclear export factor [Candidatus Nomurabacteria bacterium]|nr:nuclear export factor [Candidatus Nomurabacteria bacterium]
MKKLLLALPLLALSFTAFAHVVVTPNKVGIGMFQTFTIGVPSEKSIPTVSLKLLIPSGLDYVTPNVKPGWRIEVKKNSEGKITEIDWTGGNIPAGERDDFLFSAKAPISTTNIQWKAYQTYKDGSIISWDLDADAQPNKDGGSDLSKSGPYSKTEVINDLIETKKDSSSTLPLILSLVSLAFSIIALQKSRRT